MIRGILIAWLSAAALVCGGPVNVRVVAANLTSEPRGQSYSPDNGNHSNPEGAGARILKSLKPDIVLIQEFNTTIPARQWINQTLGEDFQFTREEGKQIPNGIISRFPIVESGVWDDPVLDNREFVWARIRLPEKQDLWAVSVHLHSKGATSRATQSVALAKYLTDKLPEDAWLVIGGDFNTRTEDEKCFSVLTKVVEVPETPPSDGFGNIHTNAPRNKPYDWVLVSKPFQKLAVPTQLAGREFKHGLVFDTRVFEGIGELSPVKKDDSGVPNMQHMAVVRDFKLPEE